MRIGSSVKALMGGKQKPHSFDSAHQRPASAAWSSSKSSSSSASVAGTVRSASSPGHLGESVQEGATRIPVLGHSVVFTWMRKSAQQHEASRSMISSMRKKFRLGVVAGPRADSDCIFVPLDDILREYQNYCADFGPLSIASVANFTARMEEAMEQQKAEEGKQIVLCSSDDTESRTNAACLIACWLILERGCSAEESWAPFFPSHQETPFLHFREASYIHESAQFQLHITDVLEGVAKARDHGLISLAGFDVTRYTEYDNPRVANMNTIVPGLFIAFAGPKDEAHTRAPLGICEHAPEELLDIFRAEGVSDIVRLNEKQYDATAFTSAGFSHHDIIFEDCSNPTASVLKHWFEVCAERSGAVAVHCKAGLGRTGVLIAAWLMRKYGFTGRQVIGFMRIMRPGSILGPQQNFVVDNEGLFLAMGDPDVYDETVMYKDCAPVPRRRAAAPHEVKRVEFAAAPEGSLDLLDGSRRRSSSETDMSENETVHGESKRASLRDDDLMSGIEEVSNENDEVQRVSSVASEGLCDMDSAVARNCSMDGDDWAGAVEEAMRVLRARENTEAMNRRARKMCNEELGGGGDGPASMRGNDGPAAMRSKGKALAAASAESSSCRHERHGGRRVV